MLFKKTSIVVFGLIATIWCKPLLAQENEKEQTINEQISLFQNALDKKQFTKAIGYFDTAWNLDSAISMPYLVKYCTALASIGEYEKVYNRLQPFMEEENLPKYLKEKAKSLYLISSYAKNHPANNEITITNAGDNINSPAAEYFPSINFQDSLFIFMRRPDWQREDFFTSVLTPQGFTKADLLLDSLNLTPKKGSASFTKDMQTMYFAAEYYGLGYGRYDIYRVKRTPKGWSAPINLGVSVNTDFWESAPSISIDGNALYFCSNRPDGYGGIDIYVSYKNEQGYWEEAENLGPDINTEGDEQTPFIHGDNKTLFFASNGWPGYGGSDLFVSKKENGAWSKPINLGYPINTYDNEGSITVQSNGVDAYIASDRADSRGGLDIYKVLLAKNTRANWKDTTQPKPIIVQAPVVVPELKIIPNKPQIFNNLLFALNSAELINKDAPELNAIVNYLKSNLIAKIIVEGHTDNTGTAANNLILSTQRAKTIQQYLMDKGIALNRITSIGYGDTKPIADNKTEQGRATNRRTSFTIILPVQK